MIAIRFVESSWRIPDDDDLPDDCGDSVIDDRELSFRDLVLLMRHEYTNPSCWPAVGATYEWLNAEPETDYRFGVTTERSIHFDRNNPARRAKYWRLAMRAAGLVKGAA
jgi:hypothetical protein